MKTIIRNSEVNDIYGEFFCEEHSASIVIIFPGLKYGHDKPLLYYARKAATKSKKDVLCINYEKSLDWDDIGKEKINVVANQCLEIINKCIDKKYKKIYFVAKSIGTEVCGSAAEKLNISNGSFLYLTPTYAAVKYIIESNCTVITGTKDEIFGDKYIEEVYKLHNVNLMLVEGGNHSLEIESDLISSIDTLKKVANLYIRFFEED